MINTLDILILGALALGLIRGLWTGVIRQVATILGFILSFVLAVQFMRPVSDLIAGSLDVSDRIAPVVAFVLIFVVVEILVYAVARILENVIGAMKL